MSLTAFILLTLEDTGVEFKRTIIGWMKLTDFKSQYAIVLMNILKRREGDPIFFVNPTQLLMGEIPTRL